MKTKRFTSLLVAAAVLFLGGLYLFAPKSEPPVVHSNERGVEHRLTVYKSATCGCCAVWVNYMRAKDYEVEVRDTEDMDAVKRNYSIPESLLSCHTTIVNDGQYFIEGHIPEEAISKLLEEEPAIEGIGMPGMPSASPGMPGPKMGPFEIMQVDEDYQVMPYMSL